MRIIEKMQKRAFIGFKKMGGKMEVVAIIFRFLCPIH